MEAEQLVEHKHLPAPPRQCKRLLQGRRPHLVRAQVHRHQARQVRRPPTPARRRLAVPVRILQVDKGALPHANAVRSGDHPQGGLHGPALFGKAGAYSIFTPACFTISLMLLQSVCSSIANFSSVIVFGSASCA